jgi:hypothetical protein
LKVDTPYGREVDALLTPDVIEGLQRAELVLRVALDDVRSAMDVLEPLTDAKEAICRRLHAEAPDVDFDAGDAVFDALRDRTAYGQAIDFTFELLNEVQRVTG